MEPRLQFVQDLVKPLRVTPGQTVKLARDYDPGYTGGLQSRDEATARMADGLDLLVDYQDRLAAQDTFGLVLVLQGLDAAGKDGTVKHVMSGVNPQGCEVTAFKRPSPDELSHDFLWRCEKALPARGRIGIFNRSYYEEVLVTRVHPDVLAAQHLPPDAASGKKLWHQRYEDINAFEHHLQRNGTRLVKLFLHVSKDEQKQRLLERLDNPAKHWKFSAADLAERAYFDEYTHAYERALTATSTPWAPWYVVPADHKYAGRALVGGVLAHVIEQLDLHLPEPDGDELASLDRARQALLAE